MAFRAGSAFGTPRGIPLRENFEVCDLFANFALMKRIFLVFVLVATACGLHAGDVEEFYAAPEAARARIDSLVASTPADSLPGLLERVSDLLFEPTSPSYCEGLMALYLEAALPRLADETEREVARWKLEEVCRVNAEGTEAADFRFDLQGGPRGCRMSRYLKGQPLCVVFYDPDCRHCAQVIKELEGLSARVNVLAVCVDSTPERWAETCGSLPGGWARAYDRSDVSENETYVLRGLPSIYLLDADRRVVLKNPSAQRLINYLDR